MMPTLAGVQAGVSPFPALTWHSQWGSGRSHRAPRGRHRRPPAALPAGSARPWRPRAVVWCPSPAGMGSFSPAACTWHEAPGPPWAHTPSGVPEPHQSSPGGRSWPGHPGRAGAGRSPGCPSARLSAIAAEERAGNGGICPHCHRGLPEPPPHLAEVLGSDAVIIPAGQLVDEGQHLVLGTDELRLGGAGGWAVGFGGEEGAPSQS